MAQKTIQSTVAFQDPQGNVANAGVLVLDLSQAAEITSGGGQVAPTRVSITLTSLGLIPGGTTIWANDQLTPSGTTYHARLFSSGGNLLADFGQWSIAGASPIDLSQIIPTTTGASYPGVVLLNPAAQQKILGFPLELATNLVLDGATSGSTALQASSTAGGTATLPNNTGTIAELNLAQTWTAAQTFNNANLILAGSSSGSTTLEASATASGIATLPANTGTIAELNLAQEWTAAQTFDSGDFLLKSAGGGSTTVQPASSASNFTITVPATTATLAVVPTLTLKKGTGGGNYTTTSASYVQVDGTNLLYTVTIPTGWKLLINAAGDGLTAGTAVFFGVAIADGGSVLQELNILSPSTGAFTGWALAWVINGDGASHTIDLRFKTSNAADAATIGNNSSTHIPTMTFVLSPSN